jgi:dTDP-4-amino-4,6-dideoxygalactose transaminase
MDIYKEYTVEQIEYNNIRGISLPSSPLLSDSEVQYIGNKFIKILSKGVK